jgi:TfoX/Sxy family transcriptional regulator of competence genes
VPDTREMPSFKGPGEAAAARFAEVMASYPDAPVRKTFGSPCAYINGNMAVGWHSTGWFVKLPPDEAKELMEKDGGTQFMPMPGRAMNGFYTLPSSVVDDEAALRSWIERSFDYVRSLPPKETAKKAGLTSK